MKIVILAGYAPSLVNFRGDLIKDMIKAGHTVTAIAPEENYTKEINALGAEYIPVPFNRAGVNPIKDFKLIKDLQKVLKKEKPDVFFGYTIKPVVYGCVAAKRAGIQNIYAMITGLGSVFIGKGFKTTLLKMISKTLYKNALDKCRRVIFQNSDDQNDFVSMGIVDKEKCSIVNGSGVNMEHFKKKPLPKKPVFLMIARLLRDKGVFEYLEAARIVKKTHPEADLHLVGPFDQNPSSLKKEDLQEYMDSGDIIYHGSTDDVRPFIEMCSVYVLPSYREGTPRTVLEAMAMGRPIITTDVPGCRQTVIDGETGLLADVKDYTSLAAKLIWMAENHHLATKMGMAGNAYCEGKYNVKTVNKVMIKEMEL